MGNCPIPKVPFAVSIELLRAAARMKLHNVAEPIQLLRAAQTRHLPPTSLFPHSWPHHPVSLLTYQACQLSDTSISQFNYLDHKKLFIRFPLSSPFSIRLKSRMV